MLSLPFPKYMHRFILYISLNHKNLTKHCPSWAQPVFKEAICHLMKDLPKATFRNLTGRSNIPASMLEEVLPCTETWQIQLLSLDSGCRVTVSGRETFRSSDCDGSTGTLAQRARLLAGSSCVETAGNVKLAANKIFFK